MSKQFAYFLLAPVLCVSLLMGFVTSAQAQTLLPTPTSILAPVPEATQQIIALASESDYFTFAQIGRSEITLFGPLDQAVFSFGLPGDWKLKEGAEITLSLWVSMTSGGTLTSQNQNIPSAIRSTGILTVQLNGVTLGDILLEKDGEITARFQIPLEALTSTRTDGNMLVNLILNSATSCAVFNDQLDVIVHTNSSFTFPHELIQPDTNLANFPRPIVQNSFVPDTALFVVPDQPSAGELQAALSVAGGLGNLSNQKLIMDVTTVSKLTPEQKAVSNLILIGKAAALPVLEQIVGQPLTLSGGKFQLTGGSPDDGVVEMVNSPWNKSGVILVVSGNTDKGTIKAGQAVSTGLIRPNLFPNLAIVDQIQDSLTSAFLPVDLTFADLGYSLKTFESRGFNSNTYRFDVPPGWIVAPDASFELVYGHSMLLNYDRSGLVVLLNDQPIGSVRFNDVSAGKSTNLSQIMIPTSLVKPGTNRLEVRASLEPTDNCSPRTIRGLWVNVWPESKLHLPINQEPIKPAAMDSLTAYPAPFIYSPTLKNTAFVLPHNDLQSWNAALQIAAQIGNNANSSITLLTAFYADEVPLAERAKYNLLVIGHPSQLPLVTEINEVLPAPFATGSDIASESGFQVTYRIPVDSPLGYIQLLVSPWNPDNIVLAVLGKQPEGLGWAISALTTSTLRSQLAGNLAVVINAKQVKSIDTRVSLLTSSSIESQTPSQKVVEPPSMGALLPTVVAQPSWILPVLIISTVLLVILIAVVVGGSRLRNRKRN